MKKSAVLIWIVFLTLMPFGGAYANPGGMSPGDIACPAIKDIEVSNSPADKIGEMPGSKNLRQGIVWLDQGRYAAAYTALTDAINQGLPDAIERAHVYQQMGLLMCRLDSLELCQRNLELAFMTNGIFELSPSTIQQPGVQNSYQLARQYFESRCSTTVSHLEANAVETHTEHQTAMRDPKQFSLLKIKMSTKAKGRKVHRSEATIFLRIDPWATVAVDDFKVVTPPVKKLEVKPGERMISIKHPNFKPTLIDANFKAGEIWIIRQMY